MSKKHHILVAGATGQVGSQVVKDLLDQGHHVRALVRRFDAQILGLGDDNKSRLEYAVGSLEDRTSLVNALKGIDTVVSSANAVVPSGKTMPVESMASGGYNNFISAAEEVGTVQQWIQSSVPTWEYESTVPELAGKRLIEKRLQESTIPATIVRNPAFMDIYLPMSGCKQATAHHPHATTKRPQHGFSKMWLDMVGNLVVKRGILLAPGGKEHGAAFIATVDVAHIMAGVVGKETSYNRIIEAGGPEWLTWATVAKLLSKKTGRKVRVVKLPAWFARLGQVIINPFSSTASNVLGLVKLVASHQPHWEAPSVISEFYLPPQTTVAQ